MKLLNDLSAGLKLLAINLSFLAFMAVIGGILK